MMLRLKKMILNLLMLEDGKGQPLFYLIILFCFISLIPIIIGVIVTDGIVTRSDVIDPFIIVIIKICGQMYSGRTCTINTSKIGLNWKEEH